jgi:hypothetical protein
MTRFAFALTSAATLLATACTSSNDHTPTAQEYDDLAQHVGSTTATGNGGGELASMQDALELSIGVMPLGLSLDLQGHVNGSRAGLTYDYQVTCTDAGGTKLATCGATTDKADVQVAWNGMLALPHLSATIDRKGHWTLAGLTTTTPRLDGDGSFTFDSDVTSILDPGAHATYHLTYDAHYDDVVFDASHAPVSGEIHYTVHAQHMDANSSGAFDVDAVITFTGNGHADLVLDGDHHYTLDLATGVVIKVGA